MIALVLLCFLGASVAQPTPTQCGDYCMNITATCPGNLAQFPDPSTDPHGLCMAACATYPLNSTLNTTGDSWDCRVYHLSLANMSSTNAQTHCPHAGFNGGDSYQFCGTFCMAYCDNIMTACTGSNAVFGVNPTTGASAWSICMQECSYYPKNTSFVLSSLTQPANNSRECRAWHSQVAMNLTGLSAATTHCGHASPQGAGVCGNTGCDNYCDNVMAVCNMSLVQWNTRDQCMKSCATWPGTGDITWANNVTTGGNSLPCRKYHAVVSGTSASAATTHCVHTGPLGGSGVCGSECEGVCNLVVGACSTMTFANCLTACAMLNSSSALPTSDILAGKPVRGTTGCATYQAIKGLASSNCQEVMNTLNSTYMTGQPCIQGSGASLVQASWAVIALVFLALGFTS